MMLAAFDTALCTAHVPHIVSAAKLGGRGFKAGRKLTGTASSLL